MTITSDAPILEVQGLSKHFDALRAVHEVDLTIKAGVTTAVIGPNGAGKTTLFNLITGRITPTAGQVTFRGEDITGAPPDAISRMGLARSFQISSIFSELTVAENVLVAVLAHDGRSGQMLRRVDREEASLRRCNAILEDLRLSEHADTVCSDLGYGDRRRVEVGMVIALEPTLVLFDEPTAGMAPAERKATTELIRQLVDHGDYTVVIIEHDVDMVMELAERIVVMQYGQIIADGAPNEVMENPEVRRAYLGGMA